MKNIDIPHLKFKRKMGSVTSKLIKPEPKPTKVNAAIQTDTPKKCRSMPDVRSPTVDIIRTPILIEKVEPDLDYTEEFRSLPLRNRLLKRLKLDPRSPTVGIYRTPILVEESQSQIQSYDSPTSVYSSNINDSLVQDIMTPLEPSVNVSDFEVPKEIFTGELDFTLEPEDATENEENKSSLRVLDRPNTYEAQKLLEEIMSDEDNFIKKVRMLTKKGKKSRENVEKSTNEIKGKIRPPLSNITSSTNSPSNATKGMKLSRNKVVPEFGLENTISPNPKTLTLWDQNNTVII